MMDKCWEYPNNRTHDGYGHARNEGRMVYTHRAVFEALVGPIPEGLELDHLCRNRACYNPRHLEPVTHAENMRRSQAPQLYARPTHCKHDHEFTERNTRWSTERGSLRRNCRACAAARAREYRRRDSRR